MLTTFDFFENMEKHGYRVFMRETNHNPCAAGKKPVAVEFSLINPRVSHGPFHHPPLPPHSISDKLMHHHLPYPEPSSGV